MTSTSSYAEVKKATAISAASNALLAFVKVAVGISAKSHGLFADGVHSLSDLVTDFLVVLAAKFSDQEADDDHPYGHQRIETAATLFLSILLIMTGGAIFADALPHLFTASQAVTGYWPFVVIIASVIVNEALYYYTLNVGKQINSGILLANAWHHRSDSGSSLVVLLGIIGNYFGVFWLDSLAAMVVALMICKMGWSIGWNSIQELIDRGLEPEMVEQIKQACLDTSGVVAVHQLRTRKMGAQVFVDVHVLINEYLTVSEGHYIGHQVARHIRKALDAVKDVTVHMDPEDDDLYPPSINLPSRAEIQPALEQALEKADALTVLERLNLHYLNNQLSVECILSDVSSVDISLVKQFMTDIPVVASVSVLQVC